MTIYIFSVVNLLNIGNIHGSLITYISTNNVTKSRDLIGCVTSQECANESYRAVIRKHTQSFFLLSEYAFNVKSFHKYLLNCILKKIIPLYLDKIKFM